MQIVDDKSAYVGAPVERLVPMPDCDHREICKHGDRTSNYKKLLNAVEDAIPLPQPVTQSLQGAASVLLGCVKAFKHHAYFHAEIHAPIGVTSMTQIGNVQRCGGLPSLMSSSWICSIHRSRSFSN
jgi:hypothetical protein